MSVLGHVPSDGQTEEVWFNESPGLYPRLDFSVRRMTSEEFAEYLTASEKLTEVQATRLMSAHVAGRVKTWSLRAKDGSPLPITGENVRRLVRGLFMRVWKVVAGLEGPDGVKGQTQAEADLDLEAQIAAAERGVSVGEAREALIRKN
jgi:hypothetical protein